MASLVQYSKYGAINTIETTKMGYYVIKTVSEAYNLQEDTKWEGRIISVGELVSRHSI